MVLKIDSQDKSLMIVENEDGTQAVFCIDENNIVIEEINLEQYSECIALIEEYLFMKYDVITLWNAPEPLKGWEESHSLLVKHKTDNPYTMTVSKKEK